MKSNKAHTKHSKQQSSSDSQTSPHLESSKEHAASATTGIVSAILKPQDPKATNKNKSTERSRVAGKSVKTLTQPKAQRKGSRKSQSKEGFKWSVKAAAASVANMISGVGISCGNTSISTLDQSLSGEQSRVGEEADDENDSSSMHLNLRSKTRIRVKPAPRHVDSESSDEVPETKSISSRRQLSSRFQQSAFADTKKLVKDILRTENSIIFNSDKSVSLLERRPATDVSNANYMSALPSTSTDPNNSGVDSCRSSTYYNIDNLSKTGNVEKSKRIDRSENAYEAQDNTAKETGSGLWECGHETRNQILAGDGSSRAPETRETNDLCKQREDCAIVTSSKLCDINSRKPSGRESFAKGENCIRDVSASVRACCEGVWSTEDNEVEDLQLSSSLVSGDDLKSGGTNASEVQYMQKWTSEDMEILCPQYSEILHCGDVFSSAEKELGNECTPLSHPGGAEGEKNEGEQDGENSGCPDGNTEMQNQEVSDQLLTCYDNSSESVSSRRVTFSNEVLIKKLVTPVKTSWTSESASKKHGANLKSIMKNKNVPTRLYPEYFRTTLCVAKPIHSRRAEHTDSTDKYPRKQVEDFRRKREIKECRMKQQIEDCERKRQIEESERKHQIEECERKHQIEECERKHQIEECESKHQINECEAKHNIGEFERKYQIEDSPRKPNLDLNSKDSVQKSTCLTTAKTLLAWPVHKKEKDTSDLNGHGKNELNACEMASLYGFHLDRRHSYYSDRSSPLVEKHRSLLAYTNVFGRFRGSRPLLKPLSWLPPVGGIDKTVQDDYKMDDLTESGVLEKETDFSEVLPPFYYTNKKRFKVGVLSKNMSNLKHAMEYSATQKFNLSTKRVPFSAAPARKPVYTVRINSLIADSKKPINTSKPTLCSADCKKSDRTRTPKCPPADRKKLTNTLKPNFPTTNCKKPFLTMKPYPQRADCKRSRKVKRGNRLPGCKNKEPASGQKKKIKKRTPKRRKETTLQFLWSSVSDTDSDSALSLVDLSSIHSQSDATDKSFSNLNLSILKLTDDAYNQHERKRRTNTIQAEFTNQYLRNTCSSQSFPLVKKCGSKKKKSSEKWCAAKSTVKSTRLSAIRKQNKSTRDSNNISDSSDQKEPETDTSQQNCRSLVHEPAFSELNVDSKETFVGFTDTSLSDSKEACAQFTDILETPSESDKKDLPQNSSQDVLTDDDSEIGEVQAWSEEAASLRGSQSNECQLTSSSTRKEQGLSPKPCRQMPPGGLQTTRSDTVTFLKRSFPLEQQAALRDAILTVEPLRLIRRGVCQENEHVHLACGTNPNKEERDLLSGQDATKKLFQWQKHVVEGGVIWYERVIDKCPSEAKPLTIANSALNLQGHPIMAPCKASVLRIAMKSNKDGENKETANKTAEHTASYRSSRDTLTSRGGTGVGSFTPGLSGDPQGMGRKPNPAMSVATYQREDADNSKKDCSVREKDTMLNLTSVPVQLIKKKSRERDQAYGGSYIRSECVNVQRKGSSHKALLQSSSLATRSQPNCDTKHDKTWRTKSKGQHANKAIKQLANKAIKQPVFDVADLTNPTFSSLNVPSSIIQSWQQSSRCIRNFVHQDPRRVMSTSNIHDKIAVQKVFIQKVPLCLMQQTRQSSKTSNTILTRVLSRLPDQVLLSRTVGLKYDKSGLPDTRLCPNDKAAQAQRVPSISKEMKRDSDQYGTVDTDEVLGEQSVLNLPANVAVSTPPRNEVVFTKKSSAKYHTLNTDQNSLFRVNDDSAAANQALKEYIYIAKPSEDQVNEKQSPAVFSDLSDDEDLFGKFEEFPDFMKVLREIYGDSLPDLECSRN